MTKIRILCATLYTLLAVGANPLTANTLKVDNLLNMRSGDMRLVAIHTEPKAMVNTTFSDENDNTFNLSNYNGKVILLNLWVLLEHSLQVHSNIPLRQKGQAL